MKHFGIIGFPLEHSFSANFFNEKFEREHIDAEYTLYPLQDIANFPALTSRVGFTGMNVTMPHKQAVIPYLTRLDDTAAQVGAVNVIQFNPNGELVGFNTDAIGFISSFKAIFPTDMPLVGKQALVLGTGGAAKAVCYGLKRLGMRPIVVSRTPQEGQLAYEQLTQELFSNTLAIINCTPLGMHPNTDDCPPIPYNYLSAAHYLYDCIYNPAQTLFLRKGQEKGCTTQNGMGMLLGQAIAAWKIWNNEN